MDSLYHRKVRKYKDTPISDKDLESILGTVRASNTGNMPCLIVVTTDLGIKQQLCEQAHFNQSMVAKNRCSYVLCRLHQFYSVVFYA